MAMFNSYVKLLDGNWDNHGLNEVSHKYMPKHSAETSISIRTDEEQLGLDSG